MKRCKCGCGNSIQIKPHHKYVGIPEYINGHNTKVNNPFKGKTHTKESKEKISRAGKGRQAWNKNKNLSKEHRINLSKSHIGIQVGENNPAWNGGSSFEPYPISFNFRFKEKIRDKFNRKCFLCGKYEQDNNRRLDIHHIFGNKRCEDEEYFVALCRFCHPKIQHNPEYWDNIILNKLGDYYEAI